MDFPASWSPWQALRCRGMWLHGLPPSWRCHTSWVSVGRPRTGVACSCSRPGTNFYNPEAWTLPRALPRAIFDMTQLLHTPHFLQGLSWETHSPNLLPSGLLSPLFLHCLILPRFAQYRLSFHAYLFLLLQLSNCSSIIVFILWCSHPSTLLVLFSLCRCMLRCGSF